MTEFLIYTVLPIMGSVFILSSIFYFMGQIGINRNINKVKRLLLVGCYIIAVTALSLLGSGLINLFTLLLILVPGYFLYNSSSVYLFYDVVFVLVLYLTDMLISYLFSFLFQYQIISFISPESIYIFYIIITRFAEFMMLKLATTMIRHKHHEKITVSQLISAILLPLSSFLILLTLLSFMEIYITTEKLLFLIINIGVLLLLNLYFTTIFDSISRNNRLKNELLLSEQKSKLQQIYYEDMEQKYQDTRGLVHDIRNHIQVLERLYEEGENAQGIEYAKDIHGMLNQLGQKYYTGHKMLNIILNDKVQKMNTQGIQPDIKVGDIDLAFMKEMDLITLFGNLLDNAIESCAGCSEKMIFL